MVIRRSAAAACAALLLAGLSLPAQAQSPQGVSTPRGAHPAVQSKTSFSWRVRRTGSSEEFRGLAAVSRKVAWVSGEAGTVLRTTDGGATWKNVSPPTAAGHALRDIEAFNARHAVALGIGHFKHSGIWVTNDGGRTWDRTFTNRVHKAFFDCMAFSSDGTGLAMSDPVNHHFRLVITHNRGQTWSKLRVQRMPKALPVEFGFAASGTCIVAGPGHQFWMASGGNVPRVFHTFNAGKTWTVVKSGMRGGATAGIYSIAFHGAQHGVAVGGDFEHPTNRHAAAATSDDGGKVWTLSRHQVFGYRSGVAYVTAQDVVAVGPTGSDVSRNGGRTWTHFDDASLDGVECASDGACWGSGSNGLVTILKH
jgi:photosystem II stability/assembly factor-like uncharacterized protein